MSSYLQSFLERFSELENQVKSHLNEASMDLKSASEKLQHLSRLVSENSSFIPSYELLKAQSVIEKLRSAILEIEQNLKPQKKFRFNKKNMQTQDTKQTSQTKATSSILQFKDTSSAVPTLSDVIGKEIDLKPSETFNQDLWFDKLTNCKIIIKGVPTALHLTHLNNCTIVGGPVLTSVFLEDCKNCTFVVACHQLRIHKTHTCDFYLHISSHPVVEECSECRFAPYKRTYNGIGEEFTKANLDMNTNLWYQVDDFNWLSLEEHSPNWKLLPEEERLDFN